MRPTRIPRSGPNANPVTDAAANAATTTAPAGQPATGPFFIGNYELTVDDKGRLLIPANVRKALDETRDGTSFVLITGSNDRLWLYPEHYYRRYVAPTTTDPVPDADMLDYMLTLFGQADTLTPDKAGRVVLPESSVDREALGKEVVLIGVQNHLQLWPRADWKAYLAEKNKQGPQLASRFKAARAAAANREA